MNYSEMSDYEINKAVAVALGAKMVNAYSVKDVRESIQYDLNGTTLLVTHGFGDGPNRFDPCNSWADAGSVIQQHGITVACYKNHKSDAWVSGLGIVDGLIVEHENPLRAAMVVFLMMQGADHAAAA